MLWSRCEILKKGGSASDAITATSLCVGVIGAYHSGIGGGGFMLVRSAGGQYEMIDFRETAPAAGNSTLYLDSSDKTASTIGGLAVGVPGELRGWELLHKRHGKLPFSDLFQPAINLARNGFKVNVDLARLLADNKTSGFMQNSSIWAETYLPNGTYAVEGDTIYRKKYADTLEKVANEGANAFYTGSVADSIIAASSATGGVLTLDDLATYSAIIRKPTNITYRNQRIFSTVAPSSGNVVLSTLKIFEAFPGSAREGEPGYNLALNRLLEADQFAYGQRTTYGDPAFIPNVTELERQYLSEAVIEENRSKIKDNTTFDPSYYNPTKNTATREAGTSHMAVIDNDGNAVSLTTTVNLLWGSKVMTDTGIILNNEMDDFSIPGQVNSFGFAASPINYMQPGKRPQSSIASSIAEDLETGQVTIATGAAGGSRIITATLQALHHFIDQGMSASEIEYQSRWHDQLSGLVYFDWAAPELGIAGFNNDTVNAMKAIGYNVTYQNPGSSSASQVVIRGADGYITAAADPRAGGSGAAAY